MEEKYSLEKVTEEHTVNVSARPNSIEVKKHDNTLISDEVKSSVKNDQDDFFRLDSNILQDVTSDSDLEKSVEDSVEDEDNDDHSLQIVESTEPYSDQFIKSETDQDDYRLKRRRETNRRAAQKCRQKQTEREGILRKEFLATESRNTKLRYEITQLKKSKELLEKILHNHYCVIKKSLPSPCQEPKDVAECSTTPQIIEPTDGSKLTNSDFSMDQNNTKTVKPISIAPLVEYTHAPIPVVVSEDQTVDGFKVPKSVPPRKIRSKGIRKLNAEELKKILKKGGKVVSIKSDLNKAMALKQNKMKAIYSSKPPSSISYNSTQSKLLTPKTTVSDTQSVTVMEITSTDSSPKLNALLEMGYTDKYKKPTLINSTENSRNTVYSVRDTMDVTNGNESQETESPLQTRTSIAANALLELNRHGLERVHSTFQTGASGPENMNSNNHTPCSIQNAVGTTDRQTSISHQNLYYVPHPITSSGHTTTISNPITLTLHPLMPHASHVPQIETLPFKTTNSNIFPVQNHSNHLSVESIHHKSKSNSLSSSSLYHGKKDRIADYKFVPVNNIDQ